MPPNNLQQPAQFTITFGGWYQRTTLHLSEVYEFLRNGSSHLDLPPEKLLANYKKLNLNSVTRELKDLEYVKATTTDGIEIRYYEDGLYIFETHASDIQKAQKQLTDYYENIFNPAVNYIFSLGAPTPKVLANMKSDHPVVVSFIETVIADNGVNIEQFGQVYSKLASGSYTVYKAKDYIFIVSTNSDAAALTAIVEMQIFFREFKDHLEKYLNIHRKVWEEITQIKDRKYLKGKEVNSIRMKLDSYQKTISLISNRINQMGSYVRTRQSISKKVSLEDHLSTLFQYRFEVLLDTLDYIKEIWKMTTDYLNSAIQVVVEIQNMSTTKSIQSLTLITTVGVIAGLIGHLSRDALPKVTLLGTSYLSLLIVCGWLINFSVQRISQNRKQRLKFAERTDVI